MYQITVRVRNPHVVHSKRVGDLAEARSFFAQCMRLARKQKRVKARDRIPHTTGIRSYYGRGLALDLREV